jgi:hypothetical protein
MIGFIFGIVLLVLIAWYLISSIRNEIIFIKYPEKLYKGCYEQLIKEIEKSK